MNAQGPNNLDRGNFVSEWFGYRVFPTVRSGPASIATQESEICPFLSTAKGAESPCIKTEKSRGVCTVTTAAAGFKRDWLVCPYRALDPELLRATTARLFGVVDPKGIFMVPAVRLTNPDTQAELRKRLAAGRRAFIYFDEKLGGELAIPGTARSPEFSFDVTILEIELLEDKPHVGRFGVLEIQTMDFHGSYGHVVRNLKDTLRMFPKSFGSTLEKNQHLLSKRMEGPNIANVFKRTFYQMMFKFQLGKSEQCAGCALAIQQSVWDSWRPHLANAVLEPHKDGSYNLFKPGQSRPARVPAWVYVFDLKAGPQEAPDLLDIRSVIATDAASFSYYALEAAPEAALRNIAAPKGMLTLLSRRLRKLWPELAATIFVEESAAKAPRRRPVTRLA
ncbi:MAG TPA: hypothetical protein VM755_05580 [Stellaceae bacterium]|nr:hypothetical protein [Stellaceae bacterium]